MPTPLDSTFAETGEPPPRVWTLRDLLLFIAFVPAGLFTANILVLLGYRLLQPITDWRLARQQLSIDPFFLLALQMVFYGLMLAFIFFLVTVDHRQPFWPTLRWRRITVRQALGCLGGGALLTVAIALLPAVLPDTNHFPLENLFSSRAAAYALGTFAILVAPFMEELIFRGILFGIFESRVGLRFAILITAILFGGLHVPEYWGAWNHTFLIFIVGLVFSLARGMSGSLTPSVFLHMGYNASMMIALFISTEHFRRLTALLSP
jgi:hypothetical protein